MEVSALFQRYLPYTTTQFGTDEYLVSLENGMWNQLIDDSVGKVIMTKPAAGQGIALSNYSANPCGMIFGDYIKPRIPSIKDVDSIVRLRFDMSISLQATNLFQIGLCHLEVSDSVDRYHRFRVYYDHGTGKLKVDVKAANAYTFASRAATGLTNIYTGSPISGLSAGTPHVFELVVYFMKGSTTIMNVFLNIDGANKAYLSLGGTAYLSDTYNDMDNVWVGLHPYIYFEAGNTGSITLSSINLQRS